MLVVTEKLKDSEGITHLRLEFEDMNRKMCYTTVPKGALGESNCSITKDLLAMDLNIFDTQETKKYLMLAHPPTQGLMVNEPGWVDGELDTFILHDGRYVSRDPNSICRLRDAKEPQVAGTLEDWVEHVGKLSSGNKTLLFSLSLAFAAPLTRFTPAEVQGGFHLYGPSGAGKTSRQKVVASVFGAPKEYIKTWKATENAIESLAAYCNDHLLLMDELANIKSLASLEDACYLIGNGVGKERLNRDAMAKKVRKFVTLALSSGERTVKETGDTLAAQTRQKIDMAQGAINRVVDVSITRPNETNSWTKLHGKKDETELALSQLSAIATNYGTAYPAFIEGLMRKFPSADHLKKFISTEIDRYTQEFLEGTDKCAVVKVVQRFALVAVAAKLAMEFGILPEDAFQAVSGIAREYIAEYSYDATPEATKLKESIESNLAKKATYLARRSERGVMSDAHGQCLGLVDAEAKRIYLIQNTFQEEFCSGRSFKNIEADLKQFGWTVEKRVNKRIAGAVCKTVLLVIPEYFEAEDPEPQEYPDWEVRRQAKLAS